jgi:hypothetical protein
MAFQGPRFGASSQEVASGAVAWTSPSNILTDNATGASITLTVGQVSHLLQTTEHGFVLPAGATVLSASIYVDVISKTGAVTVSDLHLHLDSDDLTANLAAGGTLATGLNVFTSAVTILRTEAISNDFGIELSVVGGGGGGSISIDYLALALTYEIPGGGVLGSVFLFPRGM